MRLHFFSLSLQQAGLLGENTLNAVPFQCGINMLGDLPHGTENRVTVFLYYALNCSFCINYYFMLPGPVVLMLSVLCNAGAVAPGLGMQMEALGPIKPPSVGRTIRREPESTTTANTFSTNPSALQGMSVPLLGSVLGADGSTLPMVRDFFQLREGLAACH